MNDSNELPEEEEKYEGEEEEEEEQDQGPVPEPVQYPENVTKALEPWMTASQKGDKFRKEIIPLETEDEFLMIEYVMLPLGATQKIWGNAQNLIANVEREVEAKQKRGEKVSKGVVAQLVHSFYLIGCIEKMVKKINGQPVTPKWFQLTCSQSLGNILQVWMNAMLKHKPYPKPAWVLMREGRVEEAKQAEKRGLLVDAEADPPGSSSDTDGGAGGPPSDPSSPGGGPQT